MAHRQQTESTKCMRNRDRDNEKIRVKDTPFLVLYSHFKRYMFFNKIGSERQNDLFLFNRR